MQNSVLSHRLPDLVSSVVNPYMTYYQHRISHCMEWSHPLLQNQNLLSIGFSDFATTDFVDRHQQHGWQQVADELADELYQGWGYRPRSPHSLMRFLQMDLRDKVIVPDWGKFHVYEIASFTRLIPDDLPGGVMNWHGQSAVVREGKLYEENSNNGIDLGFFRDVNLIERDISRADYADGKLTSRLKARQTTLDVTDLSESIEGAVKRYQLGDVINLRSLVMKNCAEKVLNIIATKLSPDKFELLIQEYFCRLGADAEILPKKSEDKKGDIDVIAAFEALKIIIYVQGKHHEMNSETDSWAVKQVNEYMNATSELSRYDDYTRIAWVISSAMQFSDECEELAKKANVRLVNGLEFAKMLLDAGMEEFSLS